MQAGLAAEALSALLQPAVVGGQPDLLDGFGHLVMLDEMQDRHRVGAALEGDPRGVIQRKHGERSEDRVFFLCVQFHAERL